jgi:hypothetical protein
MPCPPQPPDRNQTFPHPKRGSTQPDHNQDQGTSQRLRHLSTPPPHSDSRATLATPKGRGLLLRKEVIQPHLPVRLPCYDFVPIASPTFDHSLPKRG